MSCEDIGKNYKWNDSVFGFNRKYGATGYDYGWNAAPSSFDEGIILVGRKQELINGQTDLWAIKTDEKGLVEWEKTFGGNFDEDGYDVISTSDGGFLFVGHTWSFGLSQQVYAIKTDFYGNLIWEQTFGGATWDVGESIIELKTGGFLIAGHSNSPKISSGNTDIYLIKISNEGALIWEKGYGNLNFPNHEWAYDVAQLEDESFLVVGARDRYEQGSKNALIIKVNKDGGLLWEKEITTKNNTSEILYSISEAKNGKFYICSTNNSTNNLDQFQPEILVIDIEGNIGWRRTFLANGKSYHRFKSSATNNGDVIIIGTSSAKASIGNNEDAFMTKVDTNGNILWSLSYGTYDNDDWGWSVFEANDNNLIFVGSTKSYGASLFDIFLVGTNSEGISK